MLTPQRLRLLKDILSQPAAPFREHHVLRCVSEYLLKAKIPFYTDTAGNLVIGVKSRQQYRQLLSQPQGEPVRVFIAHMDHPGFHGTRWLDNQRLEIQWHGGSPVKHLAGARVWLANEREQLAEGRLHRASLLQAGYAIDTAEVSFPRKQLAELQSNKARTLFGGFAFRSHHWISGKRLYTRAADDLVGVFCIVSLALKLFQKRSSGSPPFIGLLTRAEEVGFVGAIHHLETSPLKSARRPVMCISLEASRTLPGARIGKGPVVRLGDRRTCFDPGGIQVLSDLAQKVLPRAHQRRIMDAGSCEATAVTAWGLPCIGISLPLGNYHNQGFEGGMDCPKPEGPAPEFVHLDDIDAELRLCQALMKPGLAWKDPWNKTRQRLLKNARKYTRLI